MPALRWCNRRRCRYRCSAVLCVYMCSTLCSLPAHWLLVTCRSSFTRCVCLSTSTPRHYLVISAPLFFCLFCASLYLDSSSPWVTHVFGDLMTTAVDGGWRLCFFSFFFFSFCRVIESIWTLFRCSTLSSWFRLVVCQTVWFAMNHTGS
jgi:hypothetical protein